MQDIKFNVKDIKLKPLSRFRQLIGGLPQFFAFFCLGTLCLTLLILFNLPGLWLPALIMYAASVFILFSSKIRLFVGPVRPLDLLCREYQNLIMHWSRREGMPDADHCVSVKKPILIGNIPDISLIALIPISISREKRDVQEYVLMALDDKNDSGTKQISWVPFKGTFIANKVGEMFDITQNMKSS